MLCSRRARRPVRLQLTLPPAEFDDNLAGRLSVAVRRYRGKRINHNKHERRGPPQAATATVSPGMVL